MTERAPNPFPLTPASEAWVRQTLQGMSLEERVGQLLFSHFPWRDHASPEVILDRQRVVDELHVGGFIVGGQSAADVIPLMNSMQARSRVPLLVCADFEAGVGRVWREATLFPTQMAVAATGDPRNARLVGEWTARESRALGVHWPLMPVCDVNINPENPIINVRSYGEDVSLVSRFAAAYIEGVQEHGGLACAKHFPGHGDTATDSHLGLAVVDQPRGRLEAVEFAPFRAVVKAGVGSVMTSHIHFPALMGDEGAIPATVSRNIMTGLLREEMGFRGLVCTDSMRMRGITTLFEPGEAAVRAIEAGVDCILVSEDDAAAFSALLEAVRTGRLTERRIAESVERILRAKAWLGLTEPDLTPLDEALAAVGQEETRALAEEMMRRAVTAVRNAGDLLPLDPARHPRLLHLALLDNARNWLPEEVDGVTEGLRARFRRVDRERVFMEPRREAIDDFDPMTPDMATDELIARHCLTPSRRERILRRAAEADLTVITAHVRFGAYKGDIGLSDAQMALVRDLVASGRPTVLAVLGSPYVVCAVPEAPCQVLTFDFSRLAAAVLPGALTGEFAISGRLPVSLPGVAERGAGLTLPPRGGTARVRRGAPMPGPVPGD